MSKEDFVKFYQDYLPKNHELQSKIDKLASENDFAAAVLDAGPKAGFSFTRQDVDAVMKASERRVKTSELSDDQLEGVAGGAAVAVSSPTVQIRSIDSVTNIMARPQVLDIGSHASTIMCCW